MLLARSLAVLTLGLGGVFALFAGSQEPAINASILPAVKLVPRKELIQPFPTNDVMRSAWKVTYDTAEGYGLFLTGAWFKKGPKEPWIQILGDARLSEMFVPYSSGSPRFWDISYNFALVTMTKDEAGPHGRLLGDPPTVVHEVRDRGIAWMDGTKGSRRGQKMVLWAALNAANYRYLIEYGFQDDGVVTFRVGSTGRNYSSKEWEGHMHNGLWRVDVDLDGPDHNSVQVMEHEEPDPADKTKAITKMRPFNGGVEGAEDWNALKFTMLTVTNTQRKNARGKPLAYDLVPLRMGNARHQGPDKEACTMHDFWATVQRPDELNYRNVPDYVQKKQSLQETNVVLWHSTPGHHEPRSEDGEMKDGTFTGATQVMWTGFDLRPRNFWDKSPLYP